MSRTKHIPDRHCESVVLLPRWLLLKSLIISTWFGVWMVNCIQFSWIIAGFFILTKLLVYTFFLEDVSPILIFVMQKHPSFSHFYRENSSLLWEIVCSPGATWRYQQDWNVCIIIYYHYYYLGFIYYYCYWYYYYCYYYYYYYYYYYL